MQDVVTAKKYFEPIGTLQELAENHMSPTSFGSCSRPSAENIGCRFYNTCEMSYKDTGRGEVGGPRNHGVRLSKSVENGSKRLETIHSCFKYNGMVDQLRANKTVPWIVASEPDVVPKNGRTFIIFQGTELDPATEKLASDKQRHRSYMKELQIQPFKRPGQNPQFANIAYANKMAEMDKREQDDMAYAREVGTEEESLDVRHQRASAPSAGALEAKTEGASSLPETSRHSEGPVGRPRPRTP